MFWMVTGGVRGLRSAMIGLFCADRVVIAMASDVTAPICEVPVRPMDGPWMGKLSTHELWVQTANIDNESTSTTPALSISRIPELARNFHSNLDTHGCYHSLHAVRGTCRISLGRSRRDSA